MRTGVVAICALVAGWPGAAAAQQNRARFEEPAERATSATSFGLTDRPLSIAKWSAVGVSALTAGYGFLTHRTADDKYTALERLCEQNRERCRDRLDDGTYADPNMEALYQDVLRLDRRARIALVTSQLGVAASVLLFILDLRHGDAPPNIPYEPQRFELIPATDGSVQLRWRVPAGP